MGCTSSKAHSEEIPSPDLTRTRYVAAVGRTGSGMTQFIRDVTGRSVVDEPGLEPQTQEISETGFMDPRGFPLVLIDTPGFDFSEGNDEYTRFKELLEWFKMRYGPNAKLDGIIYMHNIWNPEAYRRDPLSDCEDLEALCGQNWHRKVILVNSHWSEGNMREGEEKERILRNRYWKTMIRRGSAMVRYELAGDRQRALEILRRVIQDQTPNSSP